jgi:hypothetical protein
MSYSMINKMTKVGALLGALALSIPANAALIQLNFDSGFVAADVATDTTVVALDAVGSVGGMNVNRSIGWLQNSNPRSTLTVTNFNPIIDTILLNNPVVLQTFNQVNNILTVPSGTSVGWTLGFVNELTIDGVAGPLVNNQITFNETLNQTTCPLPTPNGTQCDDIYTINDVDDYIDIGGGLSLHVYLRPDNNFQCLASTTPGMVDCYTAEGNPGFSQISVVAEVVENIPEPQTLLLLGLGLAGLGFARNKRA